MDRTTHSAAESALGYFYQVRLALLEGLRRLRQGAEFLITIETLDDVVFEKSAAALDILQTKHHVSRTANLTDASVDLWKTLRIWSELYAGRGIPDGSVLILVTTATASVGHAASFLKSGPGRDVATAMQRLNSTADSSTSAENADAYISYKALSMNDRQKLLDFVYIADSASNIAGLEREIKECVYFAVEPRFLDSFLQRVEGWWYRRVVNHLVTPDGWPILSEELQSEVTAIREQFKQDNLPIDAELMVASIDASGYHDRTFVDQLRLIQLSDPRILIAIKHYFRAFEQRSRWVREDLLLVGELGKYEDRLAEEWNIRFERMKQELGDAATEEEMTAAAQALYQWVESDLHPRVRPNVGDPTISRGSLHILADFPRVGWHVEFEERLIALLESRGAST